MTLVIRDARVLTLAGARPRRGPSLGNLAVLPRADVVIEGDRIAAVGAGAGRERRGSATVIDARGRVLMPGFVDCHTHACFAGSRVDEWERRLRGETYEQIAQRGGGIMATVAATRAATPEALLSGLRTRLGRMLRCGTTTVEVKSGYGLTLEHELKMLEVIAQAGREADDDACLPQVIPTALLGHAVDPADPDFVRRTITETLPAISRRFPRIAVDVFCERGAWSRDAALALLEHAAAMGHPLRMHVDQFTPSGLIADAVRLRARSVDHLEASPPGDVARLASSETFAVLLPCSGFHLDGRYAPGRQLADAGALIALATNCNPGSAPCVSVAMAVALAVRGCGLTPTEALAAATVNAAEVLGLGDRGQILPGQRADLLLLHHDDERLVACEFGGEHAAAVIRGGRVVTDRLLEN